MKSFVILADATCDLSEEFQKEYDIGVIPGHIELPDGTEIPAFLKWEKYSREDFYASLKKNPNGYSTSPANVAEFSAAMEPYAAENVGVLLLTISSGISGAFSFASQAREELLQKYPSAEIRIVDSMRFGPGFGLMAVWASMLRAQGKTLAETTQWLEDNKNRFHQAGWLDDLSFVAKKGRITQPKAFFGTLAGVKPIGEFDYNGLTTILGKAPEVVFCPNYYQEVGQILAQAESVGLAVPFLGGDGWDGLEGYATAAQLKDAYFCANYAKGSNPDFENAYKAEYGEEYPNGFAPLGYDAAMTVVYGIQAAEDAGLAAGDDDYKQAVIDAIAGGTINGITGTFTFDEHHNPVKQTAILCFDGATPVLKEMF